MEIALRHTDVRYEQRQVIGFTESNLELIKDLLLAQLTT